VKCVFQQKFATFLLFLKGENLGKETLK
jgi:hypothetical protein